MAEAQAVDRVHRIGQTKEVAITRYCVNDSIEEVSLFWVSAFWSVWCGVLLACSVLRITAVGCSAAIHPR